MKYYKVTILISITILCLVFIATSSCVHNGEHFILADKKVYINQLDDNTRLTQEEMELMVSDILKDSDKSPITNSIRIYHPYGNAVFPNDIASPVFSWDAVDIHPKMWIVKIELPFIHSSIFIITNKTSWVPDKAIWEQIKKNSVSVQAVLHITGINETKDKQYASEKFTFQLPKIT